MGPVHRIAGTAQSLVLADIRNGHTCLEVAVGTATAFADIVKNNPEGTNIGIDLSPGMLDKARERMAKIKPGNYTLIQGSAFHLEVKDTTVDVFVESIYVRFDVFQGYGYDIKGISSRPE